MKSRLFTFLLLAVIFQINLSAQSNYVDGYVVNLKGDTLKGEIYFPNMAKNPDKIRFRRNEEEEPYLFNPGNIESFHAAGDYYVRAYVKSEITLSDDHLLTTNQDYQFRSDSAFLRVLVDGPKQLLRYENYLGNIKYYISTDSGYQYLWHKTFLKEKDGTYIKAENKRYIGQLAIYFADCEGVKNQIPQLQYDDKRLIKLFETYYNSCSKDSFVIPKTKSTWQWSFGAVAGVTNTKISFKSENSAYVGYTKADYANSYNLSIGGYAKIYLPRSNKKLSIDNELIFTSYTSHNTSTTYQSKYKYTDGYIIRTAYVGLVKPDQITIKTSYIKMNNMLRYELPIKGYQGLLMVGISNGYATKVNVKNTSNNGIGIETTKFEQGVILGTGVGYKRFALEARITFSDGVSGDPHLQSKVRRNYVLLSYRIFDQKK